MTDDSKHQSDVLIVGAGVAGLSCAAALRKRGADVTVVDAARGVGGRCATWRADDGLPLDYGVTFLHGLEAAFCAAITQVEGATVLHGWPERVEGHGVACQPRAYARREQRLAYAEGLSAWPKQLARELHLHLRTRIVSFAHQGGRITALAEDGRSFVARDVVLTAPCEHLVRMLDGWPEAGPVLDGPRHLLRMVGTVPCLALLATYPASAPELGWHLRYPEESELLLLVSNEGSKQPTRNRRALVLQARPGWSLAHLDEPDEQVMRLMLGEAGRLLGAWAASPAWLRLHRWHAARTDVSSELSGPMLLPLDSGARLGLAGELFARGAGVEAAWLSGRQLAERLGEGPRA
jgi:renalase